MMRAIQLTVACTAVMLATAGQIQAGLIYDNGVALADIYNGRLSDAGGVPNNDFYSGDEFVLNSNSTISSIEWSGFYCEDHKSQRTKFSF